MLLKYIRVSSHKYLHIHYYRIRKLFSLYVYLLQYFSYSQHVRHSARQQIAAALRLTSFRYSRTGGEKKKTVNNADITAALERSINKRLFEISVLTNFVYDNLQNVIRPSNVQNVGSHSETACCLQL